MLKVNHDKVKAVAATLYDSEFVLAEFANYFSDSSATKDKIRFIKWIRDRYSCNLSEAKYAAEQTYSKVWDRRVAGKRVASYCQQSYGGSIANYGKGPFGFIVLCHCYKVCSGKTFEPG